MVAYGTAALCCTLIFFCLISGSECYSGGSTNTFTVQRGGSVTIPCYYDSKYTQQRKFWFSDADKCSIFTNFTSETVSVIDHPAQSLFTVTMRNLKANQNGEFYCFVETYEGNKTTYEGRLEIKNAPYVSVVSSSVSGDEGGNISVKCLYSSAYKNEHKQWCRYKDKSCYTSQSSSVQISDDERESFTVLMSGLMLSDSGWYFCSVENFQTPVQITVTALNLENNTETDKPGSSEGNGESTLNNQQKETNVRLWLPVSAGLMMIIILVAVCTWKWKNRSAEDKKQINNNAPDTATVEDPVIYSTINDENPNNISPLQLKVNTIYSSMEVPAECEGQSPACGTVYTTVAPH